jgi:hypothetical protein
MKAIIAKTLRDNVENYRYLVENGGRPAYPVQLIYDRDVEGKYKDIMEYWRFHGGVLGQRDRWVRFRQFQRQTRKTAETFSEYQQHVRDYRQAQGIDGDISLLFDAQQQPKVDEWMEYQYFEHRKLAHIRARAEKARQERESEKQAWQAANGARHNLDLNSLGPGIPADMSWLFRYREESALDRFMTFLNWIEEQLAEIVREHPISHTDKDAKNVPTGQGLIQGSMSRTEETVQESMSPPGKIAFRCLKIKKATKGKRKSTSRNTNSASSVLSPVSGSGVTKARGETKSAADNPRVVDELSSAPLSTAFCGKSRQGDRVETEAKVPTNAPVQKPRKASAEVRSESQPLRRSQRLLDLAKRKRLVEEARPTIPKRQSKRGRDGKSKGQKPTPKAKRRGITKSK